MSYNVKYTPAFEKEVKRLAKKHPSLIKDIAKLIDLLENNPIQGTPLERICIRYALQLKVKEKEKAAEPG